jgi:hypothetical protein
MADPTTEETTGRQEIPESETITIDPKKYILRKFNGINIPASYFRKKELETALADGTIKVSVSPTGSGVRGPVLLDQDGNIARFEYSEDTDEAQLQLTNLDPNVRKLIAQQMKRTGYYKSSDPSAAILRGEGFTSTDMAAMVDFMRSANLQNKTIQAFLADVLEYPAVDGVGTIKVTPKEDIVYYMRQASLAQLGRMPTKTEIDQAVRSIQNAERSASASGTTAPSTQVLAVGQAQQAAPGERAAYAVGQAISRAFSVLTGG